MTTNTATIYKLTRGDGTEIASTLFTQNGCYIGTPMFARREWIQENVAADIEDIGLKLDDLIYREGDETDPREGYWTREADEPIAIITVRYVDLPVLATHPKAARLLGSVQV